MLIDLNIYHLTYIKVFVRTFFFLSVLSSSKEKGILKESWCYECVFTQFPFLNLMKSIVPASIQHSVLCQKLLMCYPILTIIFYSKLITAYISVNKKLRH